jgi:acetyl esterase
MVCADDVTSPGAQSMAIDEATRAFLSAMIRPGAVPLHESEPADLRAADDPSLLGTGPAMHAVVDDTVRTAEGAEFPVRVLVPSPTPRASVVYLHGGGWVLGNIEGYDTLARKLAAAADVTIVLVGYRLAPEHPYPAAVEDAWAGVQWTADQVGRLDGVVAPLVVAGDSAGGNLAIVTALRARTLGPQLAAALLVYPVTDTDTTRPSYLHPANQLLVSKPTMEWFFDHYLGGADRAHPDVSPLRVEDLSGFPPTALVLAEHDPLHDEGRAFGARLRAAGVSVQERLFEGQMHCFFQLPNMLPACEEAVRWLAGYLDARVPPKVHGRHRSHA